MSILHLDQAGPLSARIRFSETQYQPSQSQLMSYLKWIGAFTIGAFVGVIAAGYFFQQRFSQLTVSKQIDAAFIAAQQAEWLALLRLGETDDAIENLEKAMEVGVTGIAQWAAVDPPSEREAKSRDA